MEETHLSERDLLSGLHAVLGGGHVDVDDQLLQVTSADEHLRLVIGQACSVHGVVDQRVRQLPSIRQQLTRSTGK